MAPLEIEIYDREPSEMEVKKATMHPNQSAALDGPLGTIFVKVDEEDETAWAKVTEPHVAIQVEYLSPTVDFRRDGNKYVLHDGESITFTEEGKEYPKIKLTKTPAK